jgi:hypothetical protein
MTTAVAATFGTLAVAGCFVAADSVKTAPVADATAASAAHRRGEVHLTAYSNNDGPSQAVIVTGAIGDYGEAVSVHPDGSVDPEHDSELGLQLAHGTLRLDTASLDKAFIAAIRRDFPTDATTCSGSVAVTQQVPIVPGSGTGAYKGVGGAFTLTATLDEVDQASAAQPCDGSAAFLSQAIVVTGRGTVSF